MQALHECRTSALMRLGLAILITTVSTGAVLVGAGATAHAVPTLCPPQVQYCAGDGQPGPAPTPDPGPGAGEEPRGCGEEWRTVDPPDEDVPMWIGDGLQGDPPTDTPVVWQVTFCATRFGLTAMYRWLPVITPEIVANDLWVEVSGTLPLPTVASDPAPGVNSIVDIPVFVEVTNWTGTVTPSRCEAGFCVTVTVTPTLSYRPGEPEAPTIGCEGNGSRYDPDGSDIEAQASEPGACAYAYQQRTGAEGRPETWPAEVSVTWNITWSSTAGNGGTLPTVTRTTLVPRGVDEVQTVVVG